MMTNVVETHIVFVTLTYDTHIAEAYLSYIHIDEGCFFKTSICCTS